MRGLRVNRVVAPIVVVIALGAVYGLAAFGNVVTFGAGRQVSPPRSAAAMSVVRACPLPGMARASVAVVAGPATTGSGQAQVVRLGASPAAPLQRITRSGQMSVALVRPAPAGHVRSPPAPSPAPTSRAITTRPVQGGVVVDATGTMARGLEAEQVTADDIPAARCENPGTDFWFVGPGQHTAAHIRLFLMNTGSQSADANVEVSTDAGPLQGSQDTGIAVPPHTMIAQSLAPVLRGSRVIALHVRTSVGQVVAAVQEITSTGGNGAWLPPAQMPANQVVLPGLPAAAGSRQLFVAVPGTKDARIKLTAVTSKGSYQPTGGTGLDIPGGSAISIVLPSLSGIPAALKLSSNVPVTASAMLTGGPSGAPGVFTTASPPIYEQGVIAYCKTGGGAASELVLSAPGRLVKARITEIGASGPAGPPKTVEIPAGHSLVALLGRRGGSGRKSAFSVIVAPLTGSGPLYAGRVIEGSGAGGRVEAVLPVITNLTTVPLPRVQNTFITTAP